LQRQFWRDVFFGIYDADGFTAADRRAQRRAGEMRTKTAA